MNTLGFQDTISVPFIVVMCDDYVMPGDKVVFVDDKRGIVRCSYTRSSAWHAVVDPFADSTLISAGTPFRAMIRKGCYKYQFDFTEENQTNTRCEQKYITDDLEIKLVLVLRGSFWMSENDQNAQRQVEIPYDFFMGVYPVTQGQWESIMGNNPSWFSRTGGGKDRVKDVSDEDLRDFPVESVSWNDVQEFLKKLNAREKGSEWLYRLPKEVEWEYALRGGPLSNTKQACSYDFYFDQPTNDLSSTQANFDGNYPAGNTTKGPYLDRPCKVGLYKPNQLGIYDLHGNVWEWCDDLCDGGPDRVFRGGGWFCSAGYCRAALRSRFDPDYRDYYVGFRLARVLNTSKSGL